MAGLLSGLASLGLGNLENMDIFEDKKKAAAAANAAAKAVEKPKEEDFIYEKTVECPVCGDKFLTKIMKTGKAKLLGTDMDLRPRYEGVDTVKYDVVQCTSCGYAALTRYFPTVSSAQAKLIKENISRNVNVHLYLDDTYSYEEAIERYKLALANAVVKRGKTSEKAYICLKSAWLMRGYGEWAAQQGKQEIVKAAAKAEEEYIANAFTGFSEARQSEGFPMCGMDENTVDYLLAALAIKVGKFEVASRLISSIIASTSANARAKDRARGLKDTLLEEMKKNKESGL